MLGFAVLLVGLLMSIMYADWQGFVLLWPSDGIAIAALYLSPRRRWPGLLVAVFCAEALVSHIAGYDLSMNLMFAAGSTALAFLSPWLTFKCPGDANQPLNSFAQAFGIVGGALVASGAKSLISLPSRIDQPLDSQIYWFLAPVLAILIITPILLDIARVAAQGRHLRDLMRYFLGRYVAVFLIVALMSAIIFARPDLAMFIAVLAAIIIAVSLYGQISAAVAALAFASVATWDSLGGHSPLVGLIDRPFSAAVYLQLTILLMILTSMPLAVLQINREMFERSLRQRNNQLIENNTMLNLSEELAGIGRWRLNWRTGEQFWSPQMFKLNGMDPELGPDPGDVKHLLPDGGEELFSKIREHAEDRLPFPIKYHVRFPNGTDRILEMHANNEFDESGRRIGLFAVAMDLTEHFRREKALTTERARAMHLAAEAHKLANTDPLTGLANRRRSLDQLDKCLKTASEKQTQVALIIFDIDHFKQVNDRFGHQTGDDVLIAVADLARRQMRANDLLGRIGGEEFIWILEESSAEEAELGAERLRRAIELHTGQDGQPRVTASFGYAISEPYETQDSLFARADAALYAAKREGRNAVNAAL
ncbi:diguanylate cyclase domain-containing protein [Altericroceibacterium endophyticum]|uniref:diguanylate cyclase n=1 Tax=Altericroceibacterium endophyticum TaxID=1808508 RepID=A0A6I4T992_9SPHN|nr:diguanylate cyclase [Altericroceibacterium endophyticum]MXO66852.1 diguanylate cyclase [Altericroceibacterium endophyticum]